MKTGPLAAQIIKAFDDMPEQLRMAARYVLDNPNDVALLSMREQARAAGIQPATMTRFAKRIGFDGYDRIREIYADAVRGYMQGFSDKAGSQVAAQQMRGDQAFASELVDALQRQVKELSAPRALDSLVAMADMIASAHTVYCLGLRASHATVWHLSYVLSLMSERIVLLDAPGGIGADPLRSAGAGDVMVVVSITPYTRAVLDMAQYAASRGVRIIALTDSEVAPMAQIAAQSIIISIDSPSFFNAMTSAFAAVEILGALVAGRGGKKALDSLRRTDEHLSAFGVHWMPRGVNSKIK